MAMLQQLPEISAPLGRRRRRLK